MEVQKLDVGMSFDNSELDLPKSLPNVCNSWYVLVYPIALKASIKDKSSGFSFDLPEDVAKSHEQLITAGVVVKQGNLAYKHPKFKDPDTGEYLPWCKPGDYVVFSRASFSQTVIHADKKFYLLPDESILYTVDDIRDINPYYDYDEKLLGHIQEQIRKVNSK